jgi:hypothetical protein
MNTCVVAIEWNYYSTIVTLSRCSYLVRASFSLFFSLDICPATLRPFIAHRSHACEPMAVAPLFEPANIMSVDSTGGNAMLLCLHWALGVVPTSCNAVQFCGSFSNSYDRGGCSMPLPDVGFPSFRLILVVVLGGRGLCMLVGLHLTLSPREMRRVSSVLIWCPRGSFRLPWHVKRHRARGAFTGASLITPKQASRPRQLQAHPI